MSNLKKNRIIFLSIILFFIFGLSSCSKISDETAVNEESENINLEMDTLVDDDFTESDEDLLTVDYKEFYDELAPHGEWVEVTDKDVGLDLHKSSASGERINRKVSLSELFGVKEAFADDINFGTFFVWRPSNNLSVSMTADEPETDYVPYTNGQWVYTDAGWYFKAPTTFEETVHHHGRWIYSPTLKWVWLPGRVWAPAWVDWREQDSYVAWTPIPPSVYIVNNVITPPPVYNERYVVVERRFFTAPYVYKYVYRNNRNKYTVTTWNRIGGINVINKRVVNTGPNISLFRSLNQNIKMIRLMKIRDAKKVIYTSNEFQVYSPQFRKVKANRNLNSAVVYPNNFRKYEKTVNPEADKKIESSGNKNQETFKSNFKNNEKLKDNKSDNVILKKSGKIKFKNNAGKKKKGNVNNKQDYDKKKKTGNNKMKKK